MFLVLLRVAIGWHFLYEGKEKLDSTYKTGKPFTAEGYLRNSTGPLAPHFRGLVPDVNGLAKLNPVRLKSSWANEVRQITAYYRLDRSQQAKADAELRDSGAYVDMLFQDKEFTEKRRKYLDELSSVQQVERNPLALSYDRERAAVRRKDLDADRKLLLQPIEARAATLREAVVKLVTATQRKAAVDHGLKARLLRTYRPAIAEPKEAAYYSPEWTTLDWVNASTMYGLTAMGLCLMVGLLSRPAALAGAVFLGQVYLSMPPWPGLPPNPMAEGHYLIVNKNLIEMIACLAVASLPTGQWTGLDALLFGWIGRLRRQEHTSPAPAQQPGWEADPKRAPIVKTVDTGPIPF